MNLHKFFCALADYYKPKTICLEKDFDDDMIITRLAHPHHVAEEREVNREKRGILPRAPCTIQLGLMKIFITILLIMILTRPSEMKVSP